MQGAWVWSLVRELRFHMSWNAAKNWRGGKKKHNRKKENNSEKTSKQETSFNLKFRSLQARAPSTKDEILFSHCFVWYLKISKLTSFCQWYVSITNYETVFFFFFKVTIFSTTLSTVQIIAILSEGDMSAYYSRFLILVKQMHTM